MRVGIRSGPMIVGDAGGAGHSDYTVLGDTVNVAARLQGAAARGEILISQDTYSATAMTFPDARRRELDLKGKTDLVTAWQIAAPVRIRD
jgi:class 3 adenylate cyclase